MRTPATACLTDSALGAIGIRTSRHGSKLGAEFGVSRDCEPTLPEYLRATWNLSKNGCSNEFP